MKKFEKTIKEINDLSPVEMAEFLTVFELSEFQRLVFPWYRKSDHRAIIKVMLP